MTPGDKVVAYLLARQRRRDARPSEVEGKVDTRVPALGRLQAKNIGMRRIRIKALPEVALVKWGRKDERHSRGQPCAVMGKHVWCSEPQDKAVALREVVTRCGLGARSQRLTDEQWVQLVAFLMNLNRFREPKGRDEAFLTSASSFPYAPKALRAELSHPQVERMPAGGVRVRLYHQSRPSFVTIAIALAEVTVNPDNRVRYRSTVVRRQYQPPKEVAQKVGAHVRKTESRGIHLEMHSEPIRVPGLWLVKGNDDGRRFIVVGTEVREVGVEPSSNAVQLAHAGKEISTERQDKHLAWVAAQLHVAKRLTSVKLNQWMILIGWIYQKRALYSLADLETGETRSAVKKRHHPPRMSRLNGGGVRLVFFHLGDSLIRTTLEIVPGKPVLSNHERVAPRPAGP